MQKNIQRQMLPIKKRCSNDALSAEGWVAWGDVNYLNNDPQRAAEIWEQAAEQKDPFRRSLFAPCSNLSGDW